MTIPDLAVGPAAGANFTLATLRRDTLPEADIRPEAEILPGLRFVTDPEAGTSGRFRSPPGRLLEIEMRTERPARWFGLHLTLDVRDLEDRGLAGFAARATAPAPLAISACLRSGHPGGFSDCFFPKSLLAQPEPLTHLDVLEPGRQDELPVQAPWRELILFLPTRAFELALHDLRIFVV